MDRRNLFHWHLVDDHVLLHFHLQYLPNHPMVAATALSDLSYYLTVTPFIWNHEAQLWRPELHDSVLYLHHHPQPMDSNNDGPSLRVLPDDEVAILENLSDHHVDGSTLFLDGYFDMSYEEWLFLDEQNRSGDEPRISEESINLRTRTHLSPEATQSGSFSKGGSSEFCVVCQEEYEEGEKIGSLDCGHEFHVDCIKKWLVRKNTCPICKSPGST